MKCSSEEMRRSAMAAVRAVRSEREKEFRRRQENITGPKSLNGVSICTRSAPSRPMGSRWSISSSRK